MNLSDHNENDIYEIVKEYDADNSFFDKTLAKFKFLDKEKAANSPTAINDLFADNTENGSIFKKAQIYYAIQSGAILAFGHRKNLEIKNSKTKKLEKISADFFKLDLIKKARNSLSYFVDIEYQLGKHNHSNIKVNSSVEIMNLYNELVYKNIEKFKTISDAIKIIRNSANKRNGALYEASEYPLGKRGFGEDSIRNAISKRFKEDKIKSLK